MQALHLVDIENLASGWCHSQMGLAALDSYFRVAGWVEGDLVVVAANHRLAVAIGFDIDIAHRLIVNGLEADAADRELLDHAAGDWVQRAVDRVVVGSGDAIFAPMIERFGRLGLATMVVASKGSMARRLCEVADEVRYVPSAAVHLAALERTSISSQPASDLVSAQATARVR